jgi:hypothetical protein
MSPHSTGRYGLLNYGQPVAAAVPAILVVGLEVRLAFANVRFSIAPL